MCILYANLAFYVFLVSQLSKNTADKVAAGVASNDCIGFNSAISPQCQVWSANTSQVDFSLGILAR
jgi:hypothetical protein